MCIRDICTQCLAVVLRDAAVNVYSAVADVGTAIAIVAHSKDVAVLSRCILNTSDAADENRGIVSCCRRPHLKNKII